MRYYFVTKASTAYGPLNFYVAVNRSNGETLDEAVTKEGKRRVTTICLNGLVSIATQEEYEEYADSDPHRGILASRIRGLRRKVNDIRAEANSVKDKEVATELYEFANSLCMLLNKYEFGA